MTDQNRNQNQPNRGQQSSEDKQRTSPRQDEEMEQGMGSTSRKGPARETADTAHDRGVDPERRGFSGDRESDELGSEIEDDRTVEDTGDLDEEDIGGTGRHNR